MSITLLSLRFCNFLAVASEPVSVDFHNRCTVLCGPNNSGKTTVLTAASVLFEAMRSLAYTDRTGLLDFLTPTVAPVTHEMLNFRSQTNDCRIEAEVLIDQKLIKFPVNEDPNQPARMSFSITLTEGRKRLDYLALNGEDVFRTDAATAFLVPKQNGQYLRSSAYSPAILELPTLFADRMVFFPSQRDVRQPGGQMFNLQQLAGGLGITSWISTAMSPNPRDRASIRWHKFLKEFESEFGKFAGLRSCSFSVGGGELNIHIYDHPIPISRLGSGIGDCLLIMLVCKLAKEIPNILERSPIDLLLIEEPELHLHPRLQRLLLSYLVQYAETTMSS